MLTFVDLFCGGGFGGRGAVRGGGIPVLAVDSWDIASETYQANFPYANVITSRIDALNPVELSAEYQADVLLTSPECTSHSIARGARPGSEDSKNSALGITDWAKAFNSRWVIVENVNRMKSWGGHAELVESIEREGYSVSDLLLNSADFGSSQARKRMFLICSKEGHRVTKKDLIDTRTDLQMSAKSIIDWSDRYPSTLLYKAGRASATLERAERAIKAIGQNKPFLIVYYGSDYAGGWQHITAPLRTITTVDRFGLVTWKKNTPYLRMLQPDELKRGMGAGDEHLLPVGTRRQKVKLCGNGVCSEVMESIFRKLNEFQASSNPVRNAKQDFSRDAEPRSEELIS